MTQETETPSELDDLCAVGARERALNVVSLAADRGIRDVLETGGPRKLGRALARLYYGHYAMLVQQRDRFESEWGHRLFWRPADPSADH